MSKDVIKKADSMSSLPTFRRFDDLFTEAWDMFENFTKTGSLSSRIFGELQPKTAFPKVNVIENPSHYEVEIAVAGFDKEDVELELADGVLFIRADKEDCSEEEQKNYLCREIAGRSFRRAVYFPAEIDTGEIAAKYENGIITCKIGKVVIDKPSPIKIEISE